MTNETIRLNCMALRGIVLFPGTMEHFDVGRPKSLKAIMNAHQNDDRVFVVCQKNPDDEDPSFRQLYDRGCLIEIKQVMSLPDGTVRVLAMPLSRARMLSLWNDGEVLTAEVEIVPPDEDDDERLQAALKLARQEYEHYQYQMQKKRMQYEILSEEEQADGSLIVRLKRQYNNYPCEEYLK